MDAEMKKTLKDMSDAVVAFKEQTSLEIKEIKENGSADVLTKDQVDRINDTLTETIDKVAELEKKNLRTPMQSDEYKGKKISDGEREHLKAFCNYIRRGVSAENDLRAAQEEGMKIISDLDGKAVNITTPGDGGFAVPQVLGRQIFTRLQEVSDIRPFARVIQVQNEDYRELHNRRGTTGGWVGEQDARPGTDSPTLVEVVPTMGELYAFPSATQTSIEDLFFDVENWLVMNIADEFDILEGDAFVTGDGVKKPIGFLAGTTIATGDATRTFGVIEHVNSVGSSELYNTTKVAVADVDGHRAFVDQLYDLEAKFQQGFKSNLAFYGNKLTQAKLRKLRSVDGDLIWQVDLRSGSPGSLLGYPVRNLEAMAAEATDSLSLVMADLQRGYTIVDRVGVSMIRDELTNKPFVGFYTRKRVGGFLGDSDAIKVIKCTA